MWNTLLLSAVISSPPPRLFTRPLLAKIFQGQGHPHHCRLFARRGIRYLCAHALPIHGQVCSRQSVGHR
jgi:hypothetical protein